LGLHHTPRNSIYSKSSTDRRAFHFFSALIENMELGFDAKGPRIASTASETTLTKLRGHGLEATVKPVMNFSLFMSRKRPQPLMIRTDYFQTPTITTPPPTSTASMSSLHPRMILGMPRSAALKEIYLNYDALLFLID
jgi:hypothetical protein